MQVQNKINNEVKNNLEWAVRAEKSVLANIIMTGKNIEEVIKCGDGLFAWEYNPEIYETLKSLFTKNEPINIASIEKEYALLHGKKDLEWFMDKVKRVLEGEQYLTDVIDVPYFVSELVTARINRNINDRVEVDMNCFYDMGYDNKVLTLTGLSDYARNFAKMSLGVRAFKDIIVSEAERTDMLIEGNFDAGKITYYEPIDEIFGNMRNGETYLIGGAPKMGKTTLMISAVKTHCRSVIMNNRNNKKVLFISCEGDGETIARRMIASELRISEEKLYKDSVINKKYQKQIDALRQELYSFNLDIKSSPTITCNELRSLVAIASSEGELQFVILDHFGKLELNSDELKNARTEREQYTYKGLQVQKIAQDYNIPIIVLIHTTKDTWASGKDKIPKPSMTWFADYGALSKNCAGAIIVQRDYEYDKECSQYEAYLHSVFSRYNEQGFSIKVDCALEYAYFGGKI